VSEDTRDSRRSTDEGPFGRSDGLGTAGTHAVGQPPVGDQLPRIAGSAHGDSLGGAAAIEREAAGPRAPAPPGTPGPHGGGAQAPAAPPREATGAGDGRPEPTARSEPAEGRRDVGGPAADPEEHGEAEKRRSGPRP
jgi:hypothetical protein